MIKMARNVFLTVCASVLLSACGGGGGDDGNSGEPTAPDVTGGVAGSATVFSNASVTEDSALRYVAVTTSGAGSNGNTGALDHDGNLITGGLLGGDLNGGRTQVDLTDGGLANLTNPNGQQYVRFFNLEGSQFNRFGVVGIQTGAANVPDSGGATYSGIVEMQAANSDDSYDLTGTVNITATFAGSGNVTSAFTQLSGTGNTSGFVGTGDTGTITISNATISNGAFTGGAASGTGPLFDDISGTANLSGTRGEFFGPAADEVGGVLSISQGDLEILGVYSAD